MWDVVGVVGSAKYTIEGLAIIGSRISENETEALVAGDDGWSVEAGLRGVPE